MKGRINKLDFIQIKTFCSAKMSTKLKEDFPGGAVVKNPPANAGDTGSSPGPGATTTEAHMPRARAPQQEKPLQ